MKQRKIKIKLVIEKFHTKNKMARGFSGPINTETNIESEHNVVNNPNWQEADQLVILQAWHRSWTQDYREQN